MMFLAYTQSGESLSSFMLNEKPPEKSGLSSYLDFRERLSSHPRKDSVVTRSTPRASASPAGCRSRPTREVGIRWRLSSDSATGAKHDRSLPAPLN